MSTSSTHYPTSDSLTTYWAYSTPSTFYGCVDEVSASDADYVFRQGGNNQDVELRFGFPAFSVPAGATNISLSMRIRGRIAELSSPPSHATYNGLIRVGGTSYLTDTYTSADSAFTDHDFTWSINPNTGAAWTVDDINGSGAHPLQLFGAKGLGCFYDDGKGTAWSSAAHISQVNITVTYDAAPTEYNLDRSDAAEVGDSVAVVKEVSLTSADGVVAGDAITSALETTSAAADGAIAGDVVSCGLGALLLCSDGAAVGDVASAVIVTDDTAFYGAGPGAAWSAGGLYIVG